MKKKSAVAVMCIAAFVSAGCAKKSSKDNEPQLAPAEWTDAAGKFESPSGARMGHAVLADAEGGVLIRVRLIGLSPGWHGLHLHMVADCSDGREGFKRAGGHVDPENRDHGLINQAGSERGDLPNIFADDAGHATAEFFRAGLNLYPSEAGAAANGPYPLFDDDGFAVIVHANPDDHASQPIGGAGDRVACAAIGKPSGS